MPIFSEWWFWVIVVIVFIVGGYIKLSVLKRLLANRNRPLPPDQDDQEG